MYPQKKLYLNVIHRILRFLLFLFSFSVLSLLSSPPFKALSALDVIFSLSLSLSVSVRSVSDSVQRPNPLRTNSEDHGSFKTKDQSPNPDKDKAAGKKSSDSGEEADKDFILIWDKWGI